MPHQAKTASEKANPTGDFEPRTNRRADSHRRDAPVELLNQVEADLHGTAGVLRFSPEVERRYLKVKMPVRVRHFVRTTLLGILLYNLFLLSDAFMVPDVFAKTKVIHLCVTGVGLLIVFLVHRQRTAPESVIVLLLLIVGNAVYTSNTSRAQDAVFISFTIPLLVVFGNIVLPLPFRYAVAFSTLSAAAVSWTIWTQRGLDTGARIFAVLLEASMAFYTLIATYRIEGGERHSYLLTLREALRGESLVEQNRELSELSETDQLTGVANRRVFDRTLDQLWSNHQLSRTPIALLVIDIDHFKRWNDTYGHLNGDACLRRTADRLRSLMHAHQSLARYGGEEFVVLLEGEGARRPAAVAERLRAEIEIMPVILAGAGDKPHHITISIGCATAIPRPGLSTAELFLAADKALYAAKRAGRNCVSAESLDPLPSKEQRHTGVATFGTISRN